MRPALSAFAAVLALAACSSPPPRAADVRPPNNPPTARLADPAYRDAQPDTDPMQARRRSSGSTSVTPVLTQ